MNSDYYYDEDDDEPNRRWIKVAAVIMLLGALAAGGFWFVGANDGAQARDERETSATTASAEPGTEPGTASSSSESSDAPPSSTGPAPTSTTDGTAAAATIPTTAAAATTTAATTTAATTTAATTTAATTTAATTTAAAPTPAESSPITAEQPGDLAAKPAPAGGEPSLAYPVGPDGVPLPVVVLFDIDTITISGMVPSQAASDRIAMLAKANSKTDAALVNNLIVNPAVPIGVGVRVAELNSSRFPAGSARILPEHAKEFDRVAQIMTALPNVSVLVIGHADQQGDPAANFAISDERARAVVDYLRYLGIAPTRLSSRAAGDTELLTLADDTIGRALNRRTEFVIYGLIVE